MERLSGKVLPFEARSCRTEGVVAGEGLEDPRGENALLHLRRVAAEPGVVALHQILLGGGHESAQEIVEGDIAHRHRGQLEGGLDGDVGDRPRDAVVDFGHPVADIGRVAGEELVGAFARKDDLDLLAREERQQVARDGRGVAERFAEPGADPAQTVGEVALVEDQLVEVGLEVARGDLGHARLVEGLLGVADGKDRHPVALLLGEVGEDR